MRALLLILLFAGYSEPVVAQRYEALGQSYLPSPRPARVPQNARLSPADRGRIAMDEFARCVLVRSATGVGRALAEPMGEGQNRALARLATADCLLFGEMRFNPILFRRALFVELYRRRLEGDTHLPVVAGYSLAQATGDSPAIKVHWWLIDFADCVVAKDRPAAEQFVSSETLSNEENVTLQRITPVLGPCVTADVQVKLDRSTIKGALAEVLYRGVQPTAVAQGK